MAKRLDDRKVIQCKLDPDNPDEKRDFELANRLIATKFENQKGLIRAGIRALADAQGDGVDIEAYLPNRRGDSRQALARVERKLDEYIAYSLGVFDALIQRIENMQFVSMPSVEYAPNGDVYTRESVEGIAENYEVW